MAIRKVIDNNMDFLKTTPNAYFSPGRVNLIGEHIDYLGGNVFPCAIDLGTYAFVTKRSDKEIHFLSENFKRYGSTIVHLDNLEYKKEDNWTNYCKGMFDYLKKEGHIIDRGLNILIYGTLPNSAGLSSSASLEVLIGTMLKHEFNLDIEMIDIVKMAQKVENNYVGVNCGIMDQFAVGMSKKDTAIYLDTKTLEFEHIPLDMKEYTLVIANTNKKRALADSKYNERRSECDLGLNILQSNKIDVNELCELTVDQFNDIQDIFDDVVIGKRVHHAVYENHRTIEAVSALRKGHILHFGELMNQSHNSLRDLFEVSCIELDTLVDYFRINNAIGARMTGAGFGGCVIALVKTNDLDHILKEVKKGYLSKIGYNANFYPVKTSDGSKKLILEDII